MGWNVFRKLEEIWKLKIQKETEVQEIRIRVGKPIVITYMQEKCISAILPTGHQIMQFFQFLCQDSVYAYEEERSRGYMTVRGGHRIGFTGEVVKLEQGRYFVKYVCYMNIRIAHELVGVGRDIYPYICEKTSIMNTLLVSAPGVGKTTLLRDLVRQLGNQYTVGVVDERGEIAGAFHGEATLDCGLYTDVITGADKWTGIQVLVRTFAPQVIALDEIGNQNDANAILYASVCGCHVIATAHGANWEDLILNTEMKYLLEEKRFQRVLFLEKKDKGKVSVDIYNQDGKRLCCGRELHVAS